MNAFREQEKLLKLSRTQAPVIFDVGAHYGATVAQYRALFPKSRIYAFEPYPESFEMLRRRTAGDASVHRVNSAVADHPGKRTLFVNHRDDTNSLLPRAIGRRYYPLDAGPRGAIEVEAVTLDDFVNQNGVDRIDILKMDIQGGELDALKGASKILAEGRCSVIYTEITFIPHYEQGAMFHELCSFLQKYGYTLYNIFNLTTAKDGQLRQADALFLSGDFRRTHLDSLAQEP